MAHRSMPQPDAAGRVSPVKSTSLSVISFKDQPPDAPPTRTTKSSLQYWELAFAAFILIVVLLLGWRITKIIWGNRSSAYQSIAHQSASNAAAAINNSVTNPGQEIKPPIRTPYSGSVHKTISSEPVIVRVLVGTDGRVKDATIVHGDRTLRTAALQTVRQLNFTPYAPQGTPLEFETEVVVSQSHDHEEAGQKIQISVPQQSSAQPTIP